MKHSIRKTHSQGIVRTFLAAILISCCAYSALGEIVPSLDAADLNGDGLDGLLFLNENGSLGAQDNIFSGGEFALPSDFAALLYAQSSSAGPAAVSDFTKDGVLDLFLLYPDEGGYEAFWGPKFRQTNSNAVTGLGAGASALAFRSGSESVAALGFSESSRIVFLQAKDDLSIEQLGASAVGAPVKALAWSDIDNDGSEELIILTIDGRKQEVIYIKPNFTSIPSKWTPLSIATIASSEDSNMAVGYMNKDEWVDIVLWSDAKDCVALLGSKNSAFTPYDFSLSQSSRKKAADIDGDGYLDFISISPERDQVSAYLNNGYLVFTEAAIPNPEKPIADAAIGYFTQTKTKEIMLWTGGGASSKSSSVLSLYNLSNGKIVKTADAKAPALDAANESGYENVFIYKTSEYQSGEPYIYRSYRVDDWTTQASAITAGKVEIEREILQDGQLTSAAAVTLSGLDFLDAPADYMAGINQTTESQSVFSFGSPKLPRPVRLAVSPLSGTYNRTLAVEPAAEDGAAIYYNLNGGAWKKYTAGTTEIAPYRNATVSFYAVKSGDYSAILTQTYVIHQSPSADSDGDGIPDALEGTFGLPIFSISRDFDGDGWDDLDELIRSSDPKDSANVPLDSDAPAAIDPANPQTGDGWSDFDEAIRQTNPNDAESSPVAPGIHVGEYQIELSPGSRLAKDDQPDDVGDGSALTAWDLTSATIASATLTDAKWNLRLPGDEPMILQASEKSARTMTLLSYGASWVPCWNPASVYDGSQTGAQWLEDLRADAQSAYTQRTEVVSASSTAAVLAFEYWLATETGFKRPIQWGVEGGAPTREQLDALKDKFDLDAVYAHFESALNNGHSWQNIIIQMIEKWRAIPPAEAVDVIVQKLLWREETSESNLPPGFFADAFALAAQDLRALFFSVPQCEVSLTGGISFEYRTPILTTADGQTYVLDFGGASVVSGATISIQGTLETQCAASTAQIVRVSSTANYDSVLVLNDKDSDHDGLADQWEKYYFGDISYGPGDDADEDGYVNGDEFNAMTNPLSALSMPSTPPSTPTPTPTAAPTSEYSPTPTVTPTIIAEATATPTIMPPTPSSTPMEIVTPTVPEPTATPIPATPTLIPTPTRIPLPILTPTPTKTPKPSKMDEVILAQGFGGDTLVNVRSFAPDQLFPGATILSFNALNKAYEAILGGGLDRAVYVSTGDVNNDGSPDIVTSFGPITKASNYPNIVIPRDSKTRSVIGHSFTAFPAGNALPVQLSSGELRTAVGDFIGTGMAQIAVAQGAGGHGLIRIFQYTGNPAPNGWKIVGQITGLSGAAMSMNLNGGITLAAGDLDNDGRDELLVGQTNSSTSQTLFHVLDLNSAGMVERRYTYAGFPLKFQGNGGVELAVADLNGDGIKEIVAASQGNSRDHGDARDTAFLNAICVIEPKIENGKIAGFSLPQNSVWSVFSETDNPSGAVSLAAGELNGNAADGLELVVGTGAIVEYNGLIVKTVKPAPQSLYRLIKVNFDGQKVSGISTIVGSRSGMKAFIGSSNPLSGAIFVGAADTN